MIISKEIQSILFPAGGKGYNIQPTLLYNEGWMLRLILNWFKNNPGSKHKLSIPPNNNWYSEALLPSPFLHGKGINEGYTHADGVVGKFKIGASKKGDLCLNDDSNYFYITEAKMSSALSKGTKNAPTYNQAARNIACIAELLHNKKLNYKDFDKLGFYVIMPLNSKHFNETKNILCKSSIIDIINHRLKHFPHSKKLSSINWLRNNLVDFINYLDIALITWEEILSHISDKDLNDFYDKTLYYNPL
jgi:hypothetical protein